MVMFNVRAKRAAALATALATAALGMGTALPASAAPATGSQSQSTSTATFSANVGGTTVGLTRQGSGQYGATVDLGGLDAPATVTITGSDGSRTVATRQNDAWQWAASTMLGEGNLTAQATVYRAPGLGSRPTFTLTVTRDRASERKGSPVTLAGTYHGTFTLTNADPENPQYEASVTRTHTPDEAPLSTVRLSDGSVAPITWTSEVTTGDDGDGGRKITRTGTADGTIDLDPSHGLLPHQRQHWTVHVTDVSTLDAKPAVNLDHSLPDLTSLFALPSSKPSSTPSTGAAGTAASPAATATATDTSSKAAAKETSTTAADDGTDDAVPLAPTGAPTALVVGAAAAMALAAVALLAVRRRAR